MIYLETKKFRLREFTQEDWKNIKDLDSDPEVMKFISDGNPSSDKEVDRVMGVVLAMNKKWEHKFGFWVAEDLITNEFMGWFHMRPVKTDPENSDILELGYRFKRQFWGKGIATEGAKALIEKCRHDYGVKVFCAQAMKSNLASQNVMKKCAMTFWKDDTYEDFPGADKRVVWYKVTFS